MNDGGPAFPSNTQWTKDLGMSLRDWYAGMAMNEQEVQLLRLQFEHANSGSGPYTMAELRFFNADAMIKERASKTD